jgi:hypothetical protein
LKPFDVLIQSQDSQCIWMALRMKTLGYRVGWLNPSISYAAALYDPYFLGIFYDEISSLDFELLSSLYHVIKSPFGFSLITPLGPLDYSNTPLMEYYQFRSGMDSASFNSWLHHWLTELFQIHYKKFSLNTKISQEEFLTNGSFAYLYPKDLLLTQILEQQGIEILSSTENPVYEEEFFRVGSVLSKTLVRSSPLSKESPTPVSHSVWARARVDVKALWAHYPELPGWTLWRNIEDPLPLYDSLFIMQRVFDDAKLADLYFRVPVEFQSFQELHTVARMIIQTLSKRLFVEKFLITNIERTPFYILGSKTTLKISKKEPGLFFNTPDLRKSWGLHEHLNFENKISQDIQSYLKKMDTKGAYP